MPAIGTSTGKPIYINYNNVVELYSVFTKYSGQILLNAAIIDKGSVDYLYLKDYHEAIAKFLTKEVP